MPRPVWLNNIERNAWVERYCRTCFQPDEARRRITGDGPGCPLLARSDEGKLPTAWKFRRNAVFGETYHCGEYVAKPPSIARKTAPADTVSMFDPQPDEYRLVPVETWPDYRAEARKQKDGDHQ